MSIVKIRYARRSEARRVRDLSATVDSDWKRWWRRHGHLGNETIQRAIRDRCLLVACDGSRVVGHLLFIPMYNIIYAAEAVVAKPYRQRGIAAALNRQMFRICYQRGYTRAISDCWFGYKASAALQRSVGFVHSGKMRGIWGNHKCKDELYYMNRRELTRKDMSENSPKR